MTDEWHPFPDRDLSRDNPTDDGGHSTPPPASTTHGEATRILPPPTGDASDAPVTRRRTGVLPVAVLAGALVVGGVAGVGGAAAYDAFRTSSSSGSTSNPDLSATPRTNASSTNSTSTNGTIETVAAKVLPSVVQINVTGQSQSGSGSGIVLTKDGTILTNNHVVAVAGSSGTISVNFADGTAARAKVVGTDPVTDLAVIKAEGVSGLTPAEIGKSSQLKVGEGVVAIGSPFGLGATVTSGIVSALDRAVSVASSEGQQSDPFGLQQQAPQSQSQADQTTTYPAIQTDAAINPGNSGGPLVNLDGQVVGINSSIRTSGTSSTTEQGGSIGLGFAIPMDEVLPIVNQLRAGQTPTHARLGVSVSDNTTKNSDATGALVKTIENGGSASSAGLKSGDVITKVDMQIIDGSDSLVATIRGHRPGDTVTITVLRNGSTQTVTAKLGSDAGSTSS